MKAIDNISKVIEEVNDISQTIVSAVEEQSITINVISKDVLSVSGGAQTVAVNVAQSAHGLTEIAGAVKNVSNSVNGTTQEIIQIKTSADRLSDLSKNLKFLLSQFKI
jgi:methyl-accepting chemotaxis protein